MKKIKVMTSFLCLVFIFTMFYFIGKKIYEAKLEEVFHTYTIHQGIPQKKSKKLV